MPDTRGSSAAKSFALVVRSRRSRPARAAQRKPRVQALGCGGPENVRQRGAREPAKIAALLTYRGMRCNITETQEKRLRARVDFSGRAKRRRRCVGGSRRGKYPRIA